MRTIILGYFCIILLGAFLLCLPISARSGHWTNFFDALFTATSATCVTGLVVFDTYTYWSIFGQLVILLMIQVGGIGFMTLAISAMTLTKHKIGLRSRYTLQESVNATQVGGIVRMTRFILIGTAIFEISGSVLLCFRFCPQYGFWKGLYFSIFHAVSAFCNAGFDLMGSSGAFSSLTQYAADPLVNFVISALIIIGGIGFFVWSDIKTNRFRFRRYKLHTKVVLVTTAALIVVPFLFMLLTERNNPSFKGAPLTYFLSCLFQTITTRTAGFNTADLTVFSDATILCMIFLMLIGGSPSSTAGGLKTTTLAMLCASLVSIFKKRKNISCFHRRISDDALLQIISITALYTLLLFSCAMLICAFDSVSVKEALFETASAIGTVGLSLGITAGLSTVSHFILMALMFFGRVGGLTLLLAFHDQQSVTPSRYPVENITIG
ncbi:MAG: TrkH family potassium uptake protein [Candidatus Fimenecus sp.]